MFEVNTTNERDPKQSRARAIGQKAVAAMVGVGILAGAGTVAARVGDHLTASIDNNLSAEHQAAVQAGQAQSNAEAGYPIVKQAELQQQAQAAEQAMQK